MLDEIMRIIPEQIAQWHEGNISVRQDYGIRQLGDHRDNLLEVVGELVAINTEMWHLQDKFRSDDDAKVLAAIKAFSPLNQHRNDLIEEIDEIISANIIFSVENISQQIERAITDWHSGSKDTNSGSGLLDVVYDLAMTNTEVWHQEDIVRVGGDEAVVQAVRRMNPLNVHRSECVEKIDAIVFEQATR